MKLLYLSCHEVLEYDEIKLFLELGIDVFSFGAYLDPDRAGGGKREALPLRQEASLVELARVCTKERMLAELIKPFDVIYVMHIPRWVSENWDMIKHKRVVWRSIGQSTGDVERVLAPYRAEGLKVVRYSPRETTIPQYMGEDALIRFYKDPGEFKGWRGNLPRVITLCQSMPKRGAFCNFRFYQEMMDGLPWTIYGPENEWAGMNNGGLLSYGILKRVLQAYRVYFYTGTFPASYTLNFIEAWMTGIPIVAIGPKRGNASFFEGQSTYEIQDLIKNGETGFVSDEHLELWEAIISLLGSREYAKQIGEAGRREAIKHFGKEKIKKEWREFFRGL